ncbi:Maf family protein [Vibrio lentus]|nr:Maf family protein [Vibrio lentus]
MRNYQLVLASTSPFRQEILKKLQLGFVTAKPDCDNATSRDTSTIGNASCRDKPKSCTVEQPSLVIGSDQVCV